MKANPTSAIKCRPSDAVIGFGTSVDPVPVPELLISAILHAIEVGYRHFDTACVYMTEEPLGRAIADAIKRGLIKGREELFVTSKLWCSDAHHDLIILALKETLRKLGLDYLDLYLIHFPVRLKKEEVNLEHEIKDFKFEAHDFLPFDIKGTWEAMEECSRLGLRKSIGGSNYGGNECRVAAEETERFLLKERNACDCMVSFSRHWSILGFPCSN